jgi:hypothetical protein
MATTQLLIKRSEATAIPSSLANGELAWSGNGGILYIGANDVIVPIGSTRDPGVLTANHALVVNSTSMIDKIMFGNSTVNAVANSISFKLSNSTVSFTLAKPTAAQISDGRYFLNADGTYDIVTAASLAAAGSNTYVQFNDSGAMGAGDGFTFDKDANTLAVSNSIAVGANVTIGANVLVDTFHILIGNSTVNAHTNSSIFLVSDAGSTGRVNTTQVTIGSNVFLSTVKLSMGNSTVNATANSLQALFQDASSTGKINTTAVALGANVTLTTVALGIGNSTVNATANSLLVTLQNASGIANLTPLTLVIGSSTINATALISGANVFLDTVKLSVGNTTVNTLANSVLVTLQTATSQANLSALALTIGATVVNSTTLTTTGSLACQDAVVSGNLTINGSLTNINVTNLAVQDPLIKLANNNNATDTVDIGFYGMCDPTGSQDTWTGLFRDATDSKFKLFDLVQTEPTTTVNLGATGYHQATLVAALESNNVTITGGSIDCGTY